MNNLFINIVEQGVAILNLYKIRDWTGSGKVTSVLVETLLQFEFFFSFFPLGLKLCGTVCYIVENNNSSIGEKNLHHGPHLLVSINPTSNQIQHLI